ncbi:MAG: T9SS type A sorting domain-containing protein, partial [Bacteroidia bacterium]
WNGILEYCLGPLGESEQLSTMPGWSLQVVPNPAADQAQLVITAPQPVQNASVRIYDMNGREVAAVAGVNSTTVSLPVAELSSGVYFCQVISAEGNLLTTSKFVRQ